MNKTHCDLIAAAYKGRLEDVKRLVSKEGCDCDKPDSFKGSTALHWACRGGKLEVAQWLVEEAGADPAARNQDGRTPLFFACDGCHESVVKWLVGSCGADVNSKDDIDGQTPLHRLCSAGLVRGLPAVTGVLSYLIKDGRANVYVTDNGGKTPEHVSERVPLGEWKGKNLGIADMLKAARAPEPEPDFDISSLPDDGSDLPAEMGSLHSTASGAKGPSRPTSMSSVAQRVAAVNGSASNRNSGSNYAVARANLSSSGSRRGSGASSATSSGHGSIAGTSGPRAAFASGASSVSASGHGSSTVSGPRGSLTSGTGSRPVSMSKVKSLTAAFEQQQVSGTTPVVAETVPAAAAGSVGTGPGGLRRSSGNSVSFSVRTASTPAESAAAPTEEESPNRRSFLSKLRQFNRKA
ncbi:ankyrin repeat-containing domain protein [Tribonema minus]|uniref:Ankyrin repeat-containing domain protein n=1 Tax=Tribonema minus TaxID=303371 RepID=A0A835YJP1_9STRA|nr:ankyrin repeat-containing domain protein [Tribonema minus]